MNKDKKIAIVAVGYNRPKAMKRLLSSICSAEYNNEDVDLIVSIDKGATQEDIKRIADEISWNHGEKIVRVFSERQGLKKHIISCGDLSEEYRAVVVLEDDLTVSKYYYSYVSSAIGFYEKEPEVAGVSLYGFQMIPYSSRHFCPDNNGFDAYMMQVAMSWGQCWTRAMWHEFKRWYGDHSGDIPDDGLMPSAVIRWDARSWLKYYDRYLAESGKFFIMPYVALSTNHTESGEHAKSSTTMFEVPLLSGNRDFSFPSLESAVKYDAFFERQGLDLSDIVDPKAVTVIDLNGIRAKFADGDYLFSTMSRPYKLIREFGLVLRPIEKNLIEQIPGKGIYLYDMRHSDKAPKKQMHLEKYDLFDAQWRQTLKYSIDFIIRRFKEKVFHR